jgi:hypothetical protein
VKIRVERMYSRGKKKEPTEFIAQLTMECEQNGEVKDHVAVPLLKAKKQKYNMIRVLHGEG